MVRKLSTDDDSLDAGPQHNSRPIWQWNTGLKLCCSWFCLPSHRRFETERKTSSRVFQFLFETQLPKEGAKTSVYLHPTADEEPSGTLRSIATWCRGCFQNRHTQIHYKYIELEQSRQKSTCLLLLLLRFIYNFPNMHKNRIATHRSASQRIPSHH